MNFNEMLAVMKERINVEVEKNTEKEERLVKLYLRLFGRDDLYRDYHASQETD